MFKLLFHLSLAPLYIVFGFVYVMFAFIKMVFSGICSITKQSNRKTKYSVYFSGTTGEEYEYYVAERLKHMGFNRVEVTQLSGDYGADIIAYDPNGIKTCIQCKKYSGSVGIAAVQEIYGAMAYYDCEKAMVITTSTYTNAARELANKTGVRIVANFK